MKNRLFISIISMAVIFSMASIGVCANLVVKTGKSTCESKQQSKGGLTKTTHMTPCQAHSGKVYLLPDATSRRSIDEMLSFFSMPSLAVNADRFADSDHSRVGNNILKFPSAFYPPSLFSLHCAYLS
jgi:hypothetical protein